MKEKKKKTFLSFDCVMGSNETSKQHYTFLPREINEEKLGKEG